MEPLLQEEGGEPLALEEEREEFENESQSSHTSDEDSHSEHSSDAEEHVMGQYESGRMALGATERAYAKRIKAAVESDPELDNLTDFMYAQLAIVSLDVNRFRENLEAVLEQVQGMQDLRQEYFVRDTYEHGCEMMRRVIHDLLPGWFLSFSFLEEKGAYLRVASLVNFNMSVFTDPIKVRMWLAAIYYINHAHIPDLEAARQGFVQFIECQGYDWRSQNMLHIKAFTEAAPSFALYPILCKQCVCYHTGTFVRLLATMARRLLPKHLTEVFQFEAGCELGHLEEVFATPTLQAANQRLTERLAEALKRRYQNEKEFQL